MASENPDILDKIGRNDGMTVPEGYFDAFAKRMAESLPERPELEHPEKIIAPPSTLWQRIRPYVYMAAMFAGVWCMLKMFSTMSGTTQIPWSDNPILAEAVTNDTFVRDYIYDDIDQWEVYDNLLEEGFDLEAVDLDLWDEDTAEEITDTEITLPSTTNNSQE